MTSENDHTSFVVDELYHKTYSDLSQLNRQLPEDAVVALAREVVKRLAEKAHTVEGDRPDIKPLATAILDQNAQIAAQMVDRLYAGGTSVHEIYLRHLAPAADMLGKWWEEDRITFANVTVGMGRIYAIMRSINRMARPAVAPAHKSAFFAAVPEDDHVLGLKMAVDLARREGWEIEARLDAPHDELVEAIVASGELLIGVSAGSNRAIPNLLRLVMAIRLSVPEAKILVSGHLVDLSPDKIELMHVDGISSTFEDAMSQLDALWHGFHDITL